MKFFLAFLSIFFSLAFVEVSAEEKRTINDDSSLAVSVAFDQQGQLWRASVQKGFVIVDKSADMGKTFSKPVSLNTKPQEVAAKGEARPKVAIGPNGNIYLTWTQHLNKQFAGYIWFSRSTDGGESFELAKIVHQDRAVIGHRYGALNVAPNGKVTVAWISKRDLEATKKTDEEYSDAAIYYAVSTDNGASFKKKQKLAGSSSECCRVAMVTKPDSTVIAFWRHVFKDSERGYMIAEMPEVGEATKLTRATYGHWKLGGCPHHGGALARGGEGANWWGYHMAYFDGKRKKPGLYYSRMDGEAWVGSPAKKVGDNAKQARHPSLLSIGGNVWLAWLETAANNTKKVMGMTSVDGGKTWSDAGVLLSAKGKVDYPQLLQYKDNAYLVVNTVNGLKVTLVEP